MKRRARRYGIFIFLLAIVPLLAIYFYYSSIQETQQMDASVRADATGKFIQLSQGVTHYELSGPDTGNVVVLVHGGGSPGGYVWEKNYYSLVKAGFRVLRFDLYGRGYSDRPSIAYTRELLTQQLKELVDTLGLKAPFDLAGNSLGCNLAINFTHLYPERVKKLVLFDPASLNPGSPRWYFKSDVLSDFLLTVYWYPRAVSKQMNELYSRDLHKDYERKLSYFHAFKGVKEIFRSTSMNILTEDCKNEVVAVGKQNRKVLLFWGKQDPITVFAMHKKYQQYIPSVQFVPVDKAGHLSNFERADTINPVLIRFLQE